MPPIVIYYLDAAAKLFKSPGGPDIKPPDPYGDKGFGLAPFGQAPFGE